jgi:phosphoribosylformimino-5-aminoimidazole carboxamide ribotide isomerase
VVRLVRGELKEERVYHHNPAEIARGFAAAGAVRLHVVDLEGAFQGSQKNLKSIREITAAVDLEVQVGGGVRNLTVARNLFDAGVKRVILGTAVVEEPALAAEFLEEFGPERVIIAVDARDGFVAVKGWVESSGWDALEFAQKMQALGVLEIVYTDISRDGTLKGPNLPSLQRMARETGLSVIASGGSHPLRISGR